MISNKERQKNILFPYQIPLTKAQIRSALSSAPSFVESFYCLPSKVYNLRQLYNYLITQRSPLIRYLLWEFGTVVIADDFVL